MKGEEWIWHRIAESTARTPDEAKETISATGFLRWCEYFRKKDFDEVLLEDYLAEISLELLRIRAAWTGADVSQVTHKDRLFKRIEVTEKKQELTKEQVLARSKRGWFAGKKTKRTSSDPSRFKMPKGLRIHREAS